MAVEIEPQIEIRETEAKVPPELRQEGVSARPEKPAEIESVQQQVQEEESKQPGEDTVTLPASLEELRNLAKGPITSSITWFANFWLRIFKKAVHYGYRILLKGGKDNASA